MISSRLLALALGGLCLAGNRSPAADGTPRYALRGEILTPISVLADGYVVVAGEKIESISAGAPPGVAVYQTDGIICPGFIDLHNHLTWNVFPRWSSGRKFPNRYEWQQYPEYLMALAGPHATLIDRGDGAAMARFCEVKAIAGGSTSLAGLYPGDLGPAFKGPYHGMMRMLDIGSGFYPTGQPEGVRYQVFPFFIQEEEAQEIRAGLKDGSIRSLLIHLGEGSPVDASSINEFQMLKARALLVPGVTLIHGVSLHREQFREMAHLGVGLVWSPRSNFELYGATADVAAAKEEGVKIAIAPDWSPTGSDGMIEELKYAAVWNATLDKPLFTDAELVRMATTVPAQLAQVEDRIGSIAPGMMADLVVFHRGPEGGYPQLVRAGAADVLLVTVGGRPVYGSPALVHQLAPGATWAPLRVAGQEKAVSLPSDQKLGDWAELNRFLDAELRAIGSHLGPLAGD